MKRFPEYQLDSLHTYPRQSPQSFLHVVILVKTIIVIQAKLIESGGTENITNNFCERAYQY